MEVGDLEEFTYYHYTDVGRDNSKELCNAFDFYDLNKNDLVFANELYVVLRKLNKKWSLDNYQRMMNNVNTHIDGNINFEEFKKMMTRF